MTSLDDIIADFFSGRIESGMSRLADHLLKNKHAMDAESWNRYITGVCLPHQIKEIVHEDPFTRRAFQKPRGYAGDAKLLDFIYQPATVLDERPSERGLAIAEYCLHRPAPLAVRARCQQMAELIDRVAATIHRPTVLSIAAGHVREAAQSCAVQSGQVGRYVVLDQDHRSLTVADRTYAHLGVRTLHGTVRGLLTERTPLENFDLVYAIGLFDYLSQPLARRLIRAMFNLLRPGGRVVAANFLPGLPDVGYMETFMDWRLVYRTREEMADLAAEIPLAQLDGVHIFDNGTRHLAFLELTKSK